MGSYFGLFGEVFCSLEVAIIRILESLLLFFLAPYLGLDLQFVATAIVIIDRLMWSFRAEKVLNGRPLLTLDIQFVLDWVCVHYVSEHSQFLIVVQILHRIRQDFSIAIHHNYINVFVSLIRLVFSSISEHNWHPSSLVLQLFEANETEIESDVWTYFPDLKIIARSKLRQERNPVRLALPMQFAVKVWNLFQTIN